MIRRNYSSFYGIKRKGVLEMTAVVVACAVIGIGICLLIDGIRNYHK